MRRLVLQVEIDQVPVPDEPEEAKRGEDQGAVPELDPDGAAGIGPGEAGVWQSEKRGESADDSEQLNANDYGIKTGRERSRGIHFGQEREPSEGERKTEHAGQPDEEAKTLPGGRELERFPVMTADERGNGPEQDGEKNNREAGNDHNIADVFVVCRVR